MKTSRQQVLEYIQAHRPVTASDLGQALQMTEANARHHLAILREEGLVEEIGERLPKGKGRPAQLYGPSQQWLGDNLGLLAHSLLVELINADLAAHSDDQPLARIARRLASEMINAGGGAADRLAGGATGAVHLSRRLGSVVQTLNCFHYQARWEAHADAPRLIIGNCPYIAIIDQHPELCQVDAGLFAGLLGAQVEQLACRAPDRRGLPHCTFRLKAGLSVRL